MRIEHLTAYLNQNSSPHAVPDEHFKGKIKHYAGKKHTNVSQNANKSIENLNRPAESVSFSGSAVIDTTKITGKALREIAQNGYIVMGNSKLKVKDAPEWAVNFLKSEKVSRILKGVKNNEALFENVITLGLAGLLKPICVLLMPGTEEKDKQANATKNFVAAITGFVLTTIILTPISKGVKKVTSNVYKYVKDPVYAALVDPKLEDKVFKTVEGKELMGGKYADAFSTFYKKIADAGISPLKAAITIGFMPYLLNFLFKSKNEKKEAAKKAAAQQNAKRVEQQFTLNQNERIYKQFVGGGAVK